MTARLVNSFMRKRYYYKNGSEMPATKPRPDSSNPWTDQRMPRFTPVTYDERNNFDSDETEFETDDSDEFVTEDSDIATEDQ